MNTEAHVNDVLRAANPHTRFVDIAETIADALERDPKAVKAFNAVIRWFLNPPISRQAQKEFDELPNHHVAAFASQSTAKSTLLLVAYLLIERNLPSLAARPGFYGALQQWLPKADKYIAKLERDFLGQLLLQTEKRAAEDHEFAQALRNAATALDAQWDALLRVGRRVQETKGVKTQINQQTQSGPPKTMAMSAYSEGALIACCVIVAVAGLGLGFGVGLAVGLAK